MAMNESLKRAWVYALRSGEYRQIKGRLSYAGGYCALGVLEKLASNRTGQPFTSQIGTLSLSTAKLAGIGCNPVVKIPLGMNLKDVVPGQYVTISTLNDNAGATFEQIAGIIETQL